MTDDDNTFPVVTTQVAAVGAEPHSCESGLRRVFLESQRKCVEEIVALLVKRSERGANRAEGFETGRRTEATGDFLFDLRHAHGLLGDIMGEGNAVIGHEPPDIVGQDAPAVDEIVRLARFRFAALAGRRRARVGDVSVGQ